MEKSLTDIIWVLLCSGLVFTMQAGFLCLEAGLTRSKNSINVALKNVTDFGVSCLLFWAFGFGIMFGVSQSGWFGTSFYFPSLDKSSWTPVFFLFQLMFCGTAVTIVSGAVAERMKFLGYVITAAMISGLIYPVFGHWAWGGSWASDSMGWLQRMGFVDFAGSSVVHSVGGWASLAALIVLGPRIGRFSADGKERKIQGSNLPFAMLGLLILWFGWIGFNGGSTLAMNQQVPGIILNTTLAAGAGMTTLMFVGWFIQKYPDPSFIINGTLAGLVAITANCHAVTPIQAIFIGGIGSLITYAVSYALNRLRIDDAVDAIPVHAGAGVWGTLAVGLFGNLETLGTGLTRWGQIQVQILGIGVCFVAAFGSTFVLLFLLNRVLHLRVTKEEEHLGLNVSEHKASSELYELFHAMDVQAKTQDMSLRIPIEPFTEVGAIAERYNTVMDSLEKSENQSKLILESAGEGIFGINLQGIITFANPSAAALLDYNISELVGSNSHDLIHPKRPDGSPCAVASCPVYGAIHDGQVHHLETEEFHAKNGVSFPVEFVSTPILENGKLKGAVVSFNDITVRKKIMRELEEARDQALSAAKAKSEFLATMSHEIRTPMNAIIGMSELLSECEIDSESKNYVEILKRNGESLLNLINDILDLSKVESGQLSLDIQELQPRAVLENVMELMSVKAHQKGLELIHRVSSSVPHAILADAHRLRQVLVNLIGNAVKFTEKGEIILDMNCEKLPAREKNSQRVRLQFSVKDTGIGISKEKLGSIFDAFTQADSSTTRKYGGTGLGLSISKKIVECMGGKIWVESELGRGTIFYFNVEVETSNKSDFEVLETEHQKLATPSNLRGTRILIVDDNETNRLVLYEMLNSFGASITSVESGFRGLEELRHGVQVNCPYELILLDCRMPQMDGFEFAEMVKRDHRFDNVTIMMLTSDNRNGDITRCQKVGIDSYLIKPIRKQELLKTVDEVLAKKKRYERPKETSEVVNPLTVKPFRADVSQETSATKVEDGVVHILLVEDNLDNRLLIQSYLKKSPCVLDEAHNGLEAIEKYKAQKYDVVFMDIHMPIMDGYTATKAMREWERTQNGHSSPASKSETPIIALSASVLKEDIEKSFAAGCTDHISKPVKKEVILNIVSEYSKYSKTRNGKTVELAR